MQQLIQLKRTQRGMSFISLLIVGGVIAMTGIVIAKVVPTVVEYQSILKAVNTAKTGSSVAEVRSMFDKNAATGYFDAISGKDLIIEKISDKHVVSFAYQKEIALAGPAFLLLKYEGKSN